jgi:predicted amidophosphoribosyltransferase
MESAFEAGRGSAESKNLLLVDDICTSGATLAEASTILYEAGAKEIKAFTLSRRL